MIDCKKYAGEILDGIKEAVNNKRAYGHLVVLTVGNDEASKKYVNGKKKDCKRVGFGFTQIKFDEYATTEDVIDAIDSICYSTPSAQILNETTMEYVPAIGVTGIILQLPVPKQIDVEEIVDSIPYNLDVDGFKENALFHPCTPEGVIYITKKVLGDDLSGKTMTIVGRGKLVGAPLREMALAENMTVIQCHSHTPNEELSLLVPFSHVSVFATGKSNLFNTNRLGRSRPLIIDCGINVDESGKLCGDVVNDNEYDKITPVPGGVGLMTRAMLIKHCTRYLAQTK